MRRLRRVVTSALMLAMARDGSSGGLARLVTVTKDGASRRVVGHEEQPRPWDEIYLPKGPQAMAVE